MDFTTMKRDPKKIINAFMDDQANSVWVAKEEIHIVFPKYYLDGKLGSIDSRFNVVGMFGFVVGDSFASYNVGTIMPLTPGESSIIKIEGKDYYKLTWQAGEVMCPNTNLVLRDVLAFQIYDEFNAKGRVPPYFDNQDHASLSDDTTMFTGVNLGSDPALFGIYNAATTKNPNDLTQPARELYKTQDDFFNMEVARLPLRSVAYGADNTTARLVGSYLSEGVNSALVNPSEQTERIEQLLTS